MEDDNNYAVSLAVVFVVNLSMTHLGAYSAHTNSKRSLIVKLVLSIAFAPIAIVNLDLFVFDTLQIVSIFLELLIIILVIAQILMIKFGHDQAALNQYQISAATPATGVNLGGLAVVVSIRRARHSFDTQRLSSWPMSCMATSSTTEVKECHIVVDDNNSDKEGDINLCQEPPDKN